ncbi:MAG: hypothetical protein WC675_03135 [Patescibacteria group bacterium]|jgi:hypothetical protein
MNKKILLYLTIILLVLGSVTILSYPVLARRAGTQYYFKAETGFPCGGLCTAQGIRPLGSEAGCSYECKPDFTPLCSDNTNPNWPYVDYTVVCTLKADCGCDIKDPHCASESQHCEENEISSEFTPPADNPDALPCGGHSCCQIASTRSYTQCIACTQEFKNGQLIDINECVKAEECGDPCLQCPPAHCVVLDANKTGRDVGYKCVPDEPTQKSAAGGSSYSGSPDGIKTSDLDDSSITDENGNVTPYPKCKKCNKITEIECEGTLGNWCCKKGKETCGEKPLAGLGTKIKACDPISCPTGNYPSENTVKCNGDGEAAAAICCKPNPDGSSPCGKITVTKRSPLPPFKMMTVTVPTCVPPGDCNSSSEGYCGTTTDGKAVCCKASENQKCVQVDGKNQPACQPSSCPSGQVKCTGKIEEAGHTSTVSICCKACGDRHPNGAPSCAD